MLFHGLEGDRTSHSSVAFASAARARGWAMALPHFRGCSGELNRAPRTYHSGDHAEADWILQRLARRHAGPLLAVGISLGGNVLLRWAQEAGAAAERTVRRAPGLLLVSSVSPWRASSKSFAASIPSATALS